jgi:hypothetical protein
MKYVAMYNSCMMVFSSELVCPSSLFPSYRLLCSVAVVAGVRSVESVVTVLRCVSPLALSPDVCSTAEDTAVTPIPFPRCERAGVDGPLCTTDSGGVAVPAC